VKGRERWREGEREGGKKGRREGGRETFWLFLLVVVVFFGEYSVLHAKGGIFNKIEKYTALLLLLFEMCFLFYFITTYK